MDVKSNRKVFFKYMAAKGKLRKVHVHSSVGQGNHLLTKDMERFERLDAFYGSFQSCFSSSLPNP